MLEDRVLDARVLDLYAGSGAMALEAMSRGANEATLTDASWEVLMVLRQNIGLFDRSKDIVALHATFPQDLSLLEARAPYDLIFLDPPYKDTLGPQNFLKAAIDHKLAADTACVVWELDSVNLEGLKLKSFAPWTLWKERSWGKKAALFLEL